MSSAFRLALGSIARADIVDILERSAEQFGELAGRRYARLIEVGLRDLLEDPFRPLSKDRSEVAPGVRTYHLACCRVRAANDLGIVRCPRHFLIYLAPVDDRMRVLRITHGSADLDRHIVEAATLTDGD